MDGNRSIEVQASDVLVDVRGCLSRSEWELVYLMTSKFAQKHGLTITGFELRPAEFIASQVDEAARLATDSPSGGQASNSD